MHDVEKCSFGFFCMKQKETNLNISINISSLGCKSTHTGFRVQVTVHHEKLRAEKRKKSIHFPLLLTLRATKKVVLISVHINFAALHQGQITDCVRAAEVMYPPLSSTESPFNEMVFGF